MVITFHFLSSYVFIPMNMSLLRAWQRDWRPWDGSIRSDSGAGGRQSNHNQVESPPCGTGWRLWRSRRGRIARWPPRLATWGGGRTGTTENVRRRRRARGYGGHAREVGCALHGHFSGGRRRRWGHGSTPTRKDRGRNSPSQVVGPRRF
jgi:hypothetical protein